MDDRELLGELLGTSDRDVVRNVTRKLILTPVFSDLNKRSVVSSDYQTVSRDAEHGNRRRSATRINAYRILGEP